MLGLERWVTDREVLPGCAWVSTKCAEKTCVGLWGYLEVLKSCHELPSVGEPRLGEVGRLLSFPNSRKRGKIRTWPGRKHYLSFPNHGEFVAKHWPERGCNLLAMPSRTGDKQPSVCALLIPQEVWFRIFQALGITWPPMEGDTTLQDWWLQARRVRTGPK
jgi:hypothetical protein